MKGLLFIVLLIFLLGCKAENEPELKNAPPDVAAYLKTPEGKEIIAAAKQLQAENTRRKLALLNDTDHSVLLKECRLVIANRRAWEKSNYGDDQSFIAGNNTNLPPLIKAMKASSLSATDGQLTIELGAGFHHFGVVAFTNESAYEAWERIKTKKLLDGLWFYEEK